MEDRTLLSTFLIDNTADSGPGSLRQAIVDSNAAAGGANVIDFAISSDGGGVQMIAPLSPLPAITSSVLIDGTSQPGYTGTPLIELSGSEAGGGDGLTITGSNVTIRGLNINGFSQGAGIHISGTGATNNWIYADFLGTDPTGSFAEANYAGVDIDGGATTNLIGTNGDGIGDSAEQNLLSGNSIAGVWIDGQGTDGNVVAGNLIGTRVSGDTALPNGTSQAYGYINGYDGAAGFYDYFSGGVVISGSASGNRIGSDGQSVDADGERNIISGNASAGVQLRDKGTSGNVVQTNLIGTDLTGTIDLGNGSDGVKVESGAVDNTIGGATAGAGNLIIDNGGPGVVVTGVGSVRDEIAGNRIFANAGQAIDLGGDGVTENYSSPRQGPDNFQNFPVVVNTVAGQLQGWLNGSTPDTSFHIEFFASADYGTGGSGEAEQYLGSLEVTTDGQGQAVFDVPYSPPAGLPTVTATATDPEGNTSEVTSLRRATAQAPPQSVRRVPGQPLIFSATAGDAIALGDPDAGPLDPAWNLTLSVAAGTLTLSSNAGLAGSGDGTGSLSYRGALSAVNAALAGMTYAPPPGFLGNTTLILNARSEGASPIQAQVVITDRVFVVSTTADNGPGSLRQAIVDSNAATGGGNTIDFAIPGQGVGTIVLASPLPAITTCVLIDGFSQPGYAGTPLIRLVEPDTGSPPGLSITGSEVTVRGLGLGTDEFAFGASPTSAGVTLPSVPLPPSSTGAVATYQIDTSTDGLLIALAHPQGFTTRLSLLDVEGHVLVQSDGLSPSDGDDVIDQHLPAGTYFLQVEGTSGAGTYSLTVTLAPAAPPFEAIAVGSNPDFITSGDFNGDGITDLAVVSTYSDYFGPGSTPPGAVSILMGNGDGTFRPPVEYAVGQDPVAMVTGDFDGDGITDLAVAEGGDSLWGTGEPGGVSVLLGNGDGTFRVQVTTYPVVGLSQLASLMVGDFNGDGRTDLAVSTYFGVSVLLGHGDGTFQSQATDAVGFNPRIVAGDFNGDGRPDLAVVSGGNVSILLGTGEGTFERAAEYAVGQPSIDTLVVGDFNRDGKLDLAVTDGSDDTVRVLLGNGDGTFRPLQETYRTVTGGWSIVAGDFNGDGRTDLAVGNISSDDVSVLLGNGDGTFRVQQPSAAGPQPDSLVAGDFNGDGHTDLAVVSSTSSDVSVLLSNGDGTFGTQFTYAARSAPWAITAGDFNGDGRMDLATANQFSSDVSVLLGNGDGSFQPQATYAVGIGPRAIVVGDFNGDGRTDLAVADYAGVSVLLGNGDGSFQPAVEYAAGTDPYAIVTGDFNGDGIIDLAVADAGTAFFSGGDPGGVSVLLGNGDGTFRPAVEYAAGASPGAIVTGDFNDDGRSDLAVVDLGARIQGAVTNPGGVSVLLGNGDGTFQAAVECAVGIYPNALVAGDFNGDGLIDLAVVDGGGGSGGAGVLLGSGASVLLGNGDGTFQSQVFYPVGGYGPDSIVVGDFNGGGRTDLALADQGDSFRGLPDPSEVSVLLGNGDGTFEPEVTYPVGSRPLSLLAADFNGDGRADLATANTEANSVSVLLGEGGGTFVGPSQFATTPRATPLVADVNRDGTDDVLVVDGSGNILYRQGIPGHPGTFQPPVTINLGCPSRDIAWVPNTTFGPLLASVDSQDDAVSLYAFRNGSFARVGSLATGQRPAQIIAADLNHDGFDDLVVRNAGDGSLSVFFGTKFNRSRFMGPIDPRFIPATFGFLAPVTLRAGLGVSDVQAVDTTGSGVLDLVVTNKLTGQVSVVRNLDNDTFAPPVPYRAGTGLSAVNPGNLPEGTSLEATAGVAAGPLTPGGPTDLVTVNPGSDTIDALVGLGGGRFANPVTLQTHGPAQVVHMADFTGSGIDDLAVLTSAGVSIDLGNGNGGFLPPTTYAVPAESNGLTVADLTGNGKLDLLVGDAYGDVLVLLGNGDGTFEPYHEANQAVELAVADLTGNGAKDIIYADQGLDRVVVDYGASQSTVLADQSTGLLQPGAVALADLNGNGIPDLVVANSGSNNVLIYPGLGNGQFGPAINGGHGYFVGTDPVGITVANLTGALPDLVVADEGSNQVSILLNQSQPGGNIVFSLGPRLNSGGSGPVSTVVGDFSGGTNPDILVTNSLSNNVVLLPGVGGGFFNDTNPQKFAVGNDPGPLFVGSFDGKPDLLTVNTGSNNLTLISDFMSADSSTTTISSGGIAPDAAFSFSASSGFEDLVVGNGGDGVLALFEGGQAGLSLRSLETEPDLPDPTALAFSTLTSGQVQFYAATAGRESAELVALSLGIENPTVTGLLGASPTSVQLVSLTESSLPLVATVLTLTIEVSPEELEVGAAESGALGVGSFAPGTGVSLGQGPTSLGGVGLAAGYAGSVAGEPGARAFGAVTPVLLPWERFILGVDEALEEFRRQGAGGVPGNRDASAGGDRQGSPTSSSLPSQGAGAPAGLRFAPDPQPDDGEPDRKSGPGRGLKTEAIDSVIESMWSEDAGGKFQIRNPKFQEASIPTLGPADSKPLGRDGALSLGIIRETMAQSRSGSDWRKTSSGEAAPGRVGMLVLIGGIGRMAGGSVSRPGRLRRMFVPLRRADRDGLF